MERRLKKEKRKYSVRGHIIDNLFKCTFIEHGVQEVDVKVYEYESLIHEAGETGSAYVYPL